MPVRDRFGRFRFGEVEGRGAGHTPESDRKVPGAPVSLTTGSREQRPSRPRQRTCTHNRRSMAPSARASERAGRVERELRAPPVAESKDPGARRTGTRPLGWERWTTRSREEDRHGR